MTDLAVGVHAIRAFNIHCDIIPGIYSIFTQDRWENGTLEARCNWADKRLSKRWTGKPLHGEEHPPPHESPHQHCGCGIYGSLYLDTLRRAYLDVPSRVAAIIACEGKTIVGTLGVRTQFARVVAYCGASFEACYAGRKFLPEARSFPTVPELAEAYGISLTAPTKPPPWGPSICDWHEGQ